MFTQLYEQVFPALGDIFGKLSALAQTEFWYIIDMFFIDDRASYYYTNLFTGERLWSNPPDISGGLISYVSSWVARFIELTFPELYEAPMWIALLMGSLTLFLAIYIIKFFVEFIT